MWKHSRDYFTENQNIQTFFDNTEFMSDLPFAIYFDFETTLGKKNYNFEEDCALYPVSYSLVVAFYPCLNLEKIFVVRSFNHSFESLSDVGYLSEELLPYFDPITARQLKNCVIAVLIRKNNFLSVKCFHMN